jgi:predicted nucleotide-binding protein
MTKVRASLVELKASVAACELEGEWLENTGNGFHSFRADTGEVLNWWPSTGPVQFQGKRQAQFKALFSNCRSARTSPTSKSAPPAAKLFVLRSQERDAGDQLELALARLGFQSVALPKVDGGGQAIAEALNEYVHLGTGLGIVMLAPGD